MPSINKPSKAVKKPKATKRQLQAAESKKKIFDCAQSLFTAYGYDNVTIADICNEAGVSVGLFYNYYHSKSDISAVGFALIEEAVRACCAQFTEKDTAKDRLLMMAKTMLSAIADSDNMLSNARVQYVREAQGIAPFVFDHNRPLGRVILDVVLDGQKNGQLRTDINEHVISRIVFTYTIGATIHMLNSSNRNRLIERAISDLDLMLENLCPHNGES